LRTLQKTESNREQLQAAGGTHAQFNTHPSINPSIQSILPSTDRLESVDGKLKLEGNHVGFVLPPCVFLYDSTPKIPSPVRKLETKSKRLRRHRHFAHVLNSFGCLEFGRVDATVHVVDVMEGQPPFDFFLELIKSCERDGFDRSWRDETWKSFN
jgi:hypothetical protein